MTNEEIANSLVEYFQNLLILQYREKPNAKAEIELYVRTLFSNGNMLTLNEAFKLETAIGKQLDILAKYINISRGYSGGALNDDQLRILIKLKMAQSNSNHSSSSIDSILFNFFSTDIGIASNRNMTVVFYIKSNISNVLTAAIEKKVLPVPAGVRIQYIIVADKKMVGLPSMKGPRSDNTATFASYKDATNLTNVTMLTVSNIINITN